MTVRKWAFLVVLGLLLVSQLLWIAITLNATWNHDITRLRGLIPLPPTIVDLDKQSFSSSPSTPTVAQFTLDELRAHLEPFLSYYFPSGKYPGVDVEDVDASDALNGPRSVDSVVADYQRRYQRSPPPHFARWVKFALDHNVSVDLKLYDQIQRDFAPFRARQTKTRSGAVESVGFTIDDLQAMRDLPEIHFIELTDPKDNDPAPITINGNSLRAMPSFEPLLVRCLRLGRSLQVLPSRYFAFVMNGRDEPRSLPADVSATTEADTWPPEQHVANATSSPRRLPTYVNPHHLLRDNQCMRELYVRHVHPLTQEPLSHWQPNIASFAMSFTTIARRSLPVFSDCKLPCYHDIVVPRTEHRPYNGLLFTGTDADPNGGAAGLVPWQRRSERLVFRGGSAATPPTWPAHLSVADVERDADERYAGWRQDVRKWHWNARLTLYRWAAFQQQQQQQQQHALASQSTPSGGLRMTIDVNISDTVQARPTWPSPSPSSSLSSSLPNQYHGDSRWMSETDELVRARYVVVPDGNTWPSRFRRHLSLGAVVLYESLFVAWWQDRVRPFVEYVPLPVERSLQGLTDVLHWLQSHGDEAEAIARRGREAAVTRLRDVDAEAYTLLAMMEYAALCRYCRW